MRILALVKRIIIQTVRDKRTLALMMVAPLILLTLMSLLFNSETSSKLTVGVYNTSTNFNDFLGTNNLNVITYDNNQNINEIIKSNNLAAFISQDNNTLAITYQNNSPSDTSQIRAKVQATAQAENSILKNHVTIEDNYVYGDSDLSFFDTLNPILIGFFVFFFVFLISGISLLRERTSFTLEKLLSTPIKRKEIVLGYLLGYGIFAVIQTIIVVLFSIYVLHIRMDGSIFLLLLTNVLIAFVALSLGILLSTFANSEFQMMQFIPLVVVPQIFFTGIIPIDTMPSWLQKIALIMPLYYGAQSLQNIMIKNFDFFDIKNCLITLVLFAFCFSVLNVIGLKRYRKI